MLDQNSSLIDLIKIFTGLINMVLPVVVALALLVFFKGLVSFIAKSGDSKSHAEGKNLMVWGLIAIFAMVSVFGILKFFYSDFGFDGSNRHNPYGLLPLLPTP